MPQLGGNNSMNVEQLKIPELSLRYLKAAKTVADLRSVTRAGEQLNRSQTAISKAIIELEKQLDAALFDRTTSGVSATVYGEALSNRIAMAMAEFETAGSIYDQFKKTRRDFRSNPLFSMEISYKRLAALIALYETCDYSGAAHILGITSAAVYNSIRELEDLLDLSLFGKDPSGVHPTPYCKILVRHTKLAFSQIRHIIGDIASLNGITCGQVAIGTLPYSRTILTPRAINQLLEEQPQLDISTIEGPYNSLVASLRSGEIDLIIGAIRPKESAPHLKTETLFDDKLAILARSDHPLTVKNKLTHKALEKLQWILPPTGTPTRQLFDQYCAQHSLTIPPHAIETSSASMVRGLLLESDRVALLSEHQIHYDKKLGALTALAIDLQDTYRPIGITMLSHIRPSPATRLFLDNLRSVAKALPIGIDHAR